MDLSLSGGGGGSSEPGEPPLATALGNILAGALEGVDRC